MNFRALFIAFLSFPFVICEKYKPVRHRKQMTNKGVSVNKRKTNRRKFGTLVNGLRNDKSKITLSTMTVDLKKIDRMTSLNRDQKKRLKIILHRIKIHAHDDSFMFALKHIKNDSIHKKNKDFLLNETPFAPASADSGYLFSGPNHQRNMKKYFKCHKCTHGIFPKQDSIIDSQNDDIFRNRNYNELSKGFCMFKNINCTCIVQSVTTTRDRSYSRATMECHLGNSPAPEVLSVHRHRDRRAPSFQSLGEQYVIAKGTLPPDEVEEILKEVRNTLLGNSILENTFRDSLRQNTVKNSHQRRVTFLSPRLMSEADVDGIDEHVIEEAQPKYDNMKLSDSKYKVKWEEESIPSLLRVLEKNTEVASMNFENDDNQIKTQFKSAFKLLKDLLNTCCLPHLNNELDSMSPSNNNKQKLSIPNVKLKRVRDSPFKSNKRILRVTREEFFEIKRNKIGSVKGNENNASKYVARRVENLNKKVN